MTDELSEQQIEKILTFCFGTGDAWTEREREKKRRVNVIMVVWFDISRWTASDLNPIPEPIEHVMLVKHITPTDYYIGYLNQNGLIQ